MDVTPARAVVSETRADLSRFPTAGQVPGWMGLCPGTGITGGQVVSGRTQRCAHRAAQTLRLVAAAHQLAGLSSTMLTKGGEYVDQGLECYERSVCLDLPDLVEDPL
jgi:hypothetical protein